MESTRRRVVTLGEHSQARLVPPLRASRAIGAPGQSGASPAGSRTRFEAIFAALEHVERSVREGFGIDLTPGVVTRVDTPSVTARDEVSLAGVGLSNGGR